MPNLTPDARSPRSASPAEERSRRKREIALGYRVMASFGWGADGSGHITGRDPERIDCFWLLAYGVPFRQATVADLVLVDRDGTVVDDDRPINRAAYNIHAPIHEARPDIVGAVHFHTPYGTPFAASVQDLPMSSQEACAFHGRQAVFDGEEVDVLDLATGRRLAAAMGDARLLVLANHGLLTAGSTVGAAIGFFVLAERAAEVAVKVPGGRVISEEAASDCHASVGTEDAGWRVGEWLVASRVEDPTVVG